MTAHGRGRILRALGIAALAILATVVALEMASRWLEREPVAFKTRRYVSADPTLPELTTFGDLDSTFQRGIYKGVLYETNRLRLRSPERPQRKPPGVFRVAVLGDSYVMGDGVLMEETYAARLERELPSIAPHRFTYEVVNTGMSGLDAAHAVARYAELGVAYDPDLAVYGFTINDIEGPNYRKTARAGPDPYGVESSRLALWRLIGPGWVAIREAYFPPPESWAHELRQNYFENEAAWRDFTASIDRLGKIDSARGICTVLFIHTHLVTLNALHPFQSIYEKVAAAGRERGFHVIESFPAFRGKSERALWVSPYDSHPNADGHGLLGEALVAGLRRLPEACWTSTTGKAAHTMSSR